MIEMDRGARVIVNAPGSRRHGQTGQVVAIGAGVHRQVLFADEHIVSYPLSLLRRAVVEASTPQPVSPVDPPAAAAARQASIERVDEHAALDWKTVARRVISEVAATGRPFTADHVVEVLERDHPDVWTHNLAALGPLFLASAKRGDIRKTGRLVASTIPRRHRDLTEWITTVDQGVEQSA
jgi:hypothetical protein